MHHKFYIFTFYYWTLATCSSSSWESSKQRNCPSFHAYSLTSVINVILWLIKKYVANDSFFPFWRKFKEHVNSVCDQTIRDIFIDAIKLACEDTSPDAGQLDTIIHRCSILLGIFDEIITDSQYPPPFKEDLEQLIARLKTWRGHASIHLESNHEDKRNWYAGKLGRPAYDTPSGQIEWLHSMGFSWMKIADSLSVSERALQNKGAELEISLKYFQITEMQLDAEVQTILTVNPNMRKKMLVGALLSRGITVKMSIGRIWCSFADTKII